MKHRSVFHRMAYNWRVHGLPRCAAWFPMEDASCRRIIWPWQEMSGNGEEPEHFWCMVTEKEQHAEQDMLESAA